MRRKTKRVVSYLVEEEDDQQAQRASHSEQSRHSHREPSRHRPQLARGDRGYGLTHLAVDRNLRFPAAFEAGCSMAVDGPAPLETW